MKVKEHREIGECRLVILVLRREGRGDVEKRTKHTRERVRSVGKNESKGE